MPTSACASAGASLRPSPTIATTRPSCCSALIAATLPSGSTSAITSSMPAWRRDGLGRGPAIAGQHHRCAGRGAAATRPRRRLPAAACRRCAKTAAAVPVDGRDHDGLGPAPPTTRRGRELAAVSMPTVRGTPSVPAMTGVSVDACRARRGQRAAVEIRWRRSVRLCRIRECDDRLRERMLGASLRPPRSSASVRSRSPLRTLRTSHDLRRALGQRAGLVEHDGVDRRQPLERLAALDQHAGRGAASAGDHHRGRHRQPHRARAGDDQHRDRRRQRRGERRRRRAPASTPRTSRPQSRSPPARTPRRCDRPAAGSAPATPAPPSSA